jgi:hypothetical protein
MSTSPTSSVSEFGPQLHHVATHQPKSRSLQTSYKAAVYETFIASMKTTKASQYITSDDVTSMLRLMEDLSM